MSRHVVRRTDKTMNYAMSRCRNEVRHEPGGPADNVPTTAEDNAGSLRSVAPERVGEITLDEFAAKTANRSRNSAAASPKQSPAESPYRATSHSSRNRPNAPANHGTLGRPSPCRRLIGIYRRRRWRISRSHIRLSSTGRDLAAKAQRIGDKVGDTGRHLPASNAKRMANRQRSLEAAIIPG